MSPGERTDVARLAASLLGSLQDHFDDPDVKYSASPQPLGGGKFSQVFAFTLSRNGGAPRSYVLRLLGSASDQACLEAGLHAAAQTKHLGAPRVVLWEPADSRLGQAYLVMERAPGRTYLRGVEPLRFALDLPKLLAVWPRQLAVVLNALRRVDIDRASDALHDAGVPDESFGPGRHLRRVTATLAGEERLQDVVGWLQANRPEQPARLALVHGDLWPANVFLRDGGVCLIDWTRGGIDDPALDVGFAKAAFALMPDPFPPPAPIDMTVRAAGRFIARGISARCDDSVGGIDRVRYYEALRCALELADIVAERAEGAEPAWSKGIPALTKHLHATTGLSINFV